MYLHLILLLLLSKFSKEERILKRITHLIHPESGMISSDEDPTGEEQFLISSSNVEETLEKLFQRYRKEFHHRSGARMLSSDEKNKKTTAEICAISSSVTCGNELMHTVYKMKLETLDRCHARKKFLNCIDLQRNKCKELAETGRYPILPPESKIHTIQENAWKTLWTSGGCIFDDF